MSIRAKPCCNACLTALVFSKLASQLTGDKLIDLIIIPFILAAQTGISWACAKIVTRLFKLNKLPQNNFVTAMAVSLGKDPTASRKLTVPGLWKLQLASAFFGHFPIQDNLRPTLGQDQG